MSAASVSIVVPIYNEADNIPRLYTAVNEVLSRLKRDYEIIFVDDGSTDRSPEELRRLAALDGRVKVAQLSRNYGQTAAMSAGFELAEGDVIVTMDGDLQNDPADIPQMLNKLEEGYDLVHGWRKDRQDRLFSRKVPSKIANWLISKATGFPVRDLGCTLKAIRSEHAKDLHMYGHMHRFIPILAHWQGARCVEVVARHHPRKFGKTKYGLWRTVQVILDLMTVKFFVGYSVSPMRLFGGIGLVLLTASLMILAATVGLKLTSGTDMTGNPLLLLSVLTGMVSVQLFALGLLGEVSTRIYHECQNRRPYKIRSLVNFAPTEPRLEDQVNRAA